MGHARRSFYLAVFALFQTSHTGPTTTAPLQASRAEVCAIDPTAIVSDACASYATLDSLNQALAPALKSLTQSTDFFAYYRLNLYDQKCPVKAWDDETGTCGNIACKVDTLEDEKDIPVIWRAEELSKLEGPKAAHPGKQQQKERGDQRPLQGDLGEDVRESCVVEYDDECDERDYCVPEDESATAKGDYVSLVENPERFTGYAGQPVWQAIYQENCFSRQLDVSFQAANDLRFVFQAQAPPQPLDVDDECLEKRVFHRIISGMHASITTHICYDYLNQSTGTWGPNLQCYQDRLANQPERISNLYFDYAILLRAVAKLRTYLQSYTFCSGDIVQDAATKAKVLGLTDMATRPPPIFDENTMFRDPELSVGLKEDFRNRFRNVSRLMDCVGCDKCRLWGKLQTVGYGTALKVLFEYDENKNGENPPLRRTELVALVNTLDRVSNSLTALNEMRNMVLDHRQESSSSETAQGAPTGRYKDNPTAQPAVAPDSITNIYDDDDDEDDSNTNDPEPPISEIFLSEIRLVYRTWLFVMRSWLYMPAKIFRIVVVELSRLWSFWLGLPVQQRSWEWVWEGVPVRDEL